MLGAYGETQVRTPHLDALAARGATFSRAFAQNPVCIPSRACIQTGRYTHQHGVEYNDRSGRSICLRSDRFKYEYRAPDGREHF
jgi:arylsulfatase A-like enzyme